MKVVQVSINLRRLYRGICYSGHYDFMIAGLYEGILEFYKSAYRGHIRICNAYDIGSAIQVTYIDSIFNS